MTTSRDQLQLQSIAENIVGPGVRIRDPRMFNQFLDEKEQEFQQRQTVSQLQQLAAQEAQNAGLSEIEQANIQAEQRIADPQEMVPPFQFGQQQETPPSASGFTPGFTGIGRDFLPFLSLADPVGLVGEFAARGAVEAAGGGEGLQTAAGILGGIGATDPVDLLRLGRLGVRGAQALGSGAEAGARRVGGAVADVGAVAERAGLPSPISVASAAGPEDISRASRDAIEAEVAAVRSTRQQDIPTNIETEIAEARSRLSTGAVDSGTKRPPLARTPQQVADQALVGEDDVEKLRRLVDAFTELEPALRAELDAARTVVLGRRVGATAARAARVSPTEAEAVFTSGLRGELPAVPRFNEIRTQFTPASLDNLYGKIWREENTLRPLEQRNASAALTTLLSGEPPPPGQRLLLQTIFGRELVRSIENLTKTRGRKAYELFSDVAGLFRTLFSSFDISAVLRQGGLLSIAHPKKAFFGRNSSTWRMLRAFGSDEAATESITRIRQDPDIALFTDPTLKNPLFIRDPLETDVLKREEAFISRFAEKIPGVRASSRSFSTYLNEINTKVAKDYIGNLRTQGIDPSSPQARDGIDKLGRFLNVATGRGDIESLGGRIQIVRDVSNVTFWSSRLVVSRFQTPVEVGRAFANLSASDPAVRASSRQIARDAVAFTGSMISLLSILELSGLADVEADPRSSDFGKIRVGNTRVDSWGGFQQVARFIAQIIMGQRKSAFDEKTRKTERDRILGTFIRSKLAPGPVSTAATFAPDQPFLPGLTGAGRTFVGERIEPGTAEPRGGQVGGLGRQPREERVLPLAEFGGEFPFVRGFIPEQFVPLIAQDIEESLKEDGLTGAVLGVTAVIGTGVTSFPSAEDVGQGAERRP